MEKICLDAAMFVQKVFLTKAKLQTEEDNNYFYYYIKNEDKLYYTKVPKQTSNF